jgi:hypothetical protein
MRFAEVLSSRECVRCRRLPPPDCPDLTWFRPTRTRWDKDVPPPVVIEAQCSAPDESVIELLFRNRTQFSSQDQRTFRVRFVKGKAVLIDQKRFKE